MFKRFTPAARQIVLIATEEARGLGHRDIGPEHLLLGALRASGPTSGALAQLGLREGAIRARIGMLLPRSNGETGADVSLSPDAVWLLAGAVRLADDADEAQVGSGHILRALSVAQGARDVLAACEITEHGVLAALRAQPPDGDELFAAAIAAVDGGDPAACAHALTAIVLRRGPVAAWLAERGVDEAAVRRAFPVPALQHEAHRQGHRAVEAG